MKERPIIFSADMVRAILDGRKTQTRRVLRKQPPPEYFRPVFGSWIAEDAPWVFTNHNEGEPRPSGVCHLWPPKKPLHCPFGVAGDHLWVREVWTIIEGCEGPESHPTYRADGEVEFEDGTAPRWRSPIHMPRKFSRLTLEVEAVRVERVQEISEGDAEAEGMDAECRGDSPLCRYRPDDVCECADHSWVEHFRALWDSLHPKEHGWDSNCWVWVVSFRRLHGE